MMTSRATQELSRHSIGCLVWKQTSPSARLVYLLWPLENVGCDGFRHSRLTCKHKSCILCSIFGESRFPGNSQILDPINIFIDFPIPAPYFALIPNIPFQTLWSSQHLALLKEEHERPEQRVSYTSASISFNIFDEIKKTRNVWKSKVSISQRF